MPVQSHSSTTPPVPSIRTDTAADGVDDSTNAAGLPRSSGPSEPRRHMLLEVFAALDREAIPYCVPHGYEPLPDRIPSDVDCVIPADVNRRCLQDVFRHLKESRVVRWTVGSGHSVVLAGRPECGSTPFLQLDFAQDVTARGRYFLYSAREVLRDRRRYRQWWVPRAAIEFGASLVRRVAKADLTMAHGEKLSSLYRQDPQACREQVHRFWGDESSQELIAAAESGDWTLTTARISAYRAQLLAGSVGRHPLQTARLWLRGLGRRIGRSFGRVSGFHVTLLGPDGSGKSSVIAALQRDLEGLYPVSHCWSFPPRLLHRPVGNPSAPHALPPRGRLASIFRAILYWGVYYSPGYFFTVRPALGAGALVLHDRHLIDCLVDPRRYRYSGPAWLVRLLWRFVPKPDLVILLDAPPEVMHERKQDVSFEETVRQRQAYRQLIQQMPCGRVVDTSQPLSAVAGQINEIILTALRSDPRY